MSSVEFNVLMTKAKTSRRATKSLLQAMGACYQGILRNKGKTLVQAWATATPNDQLWYLAALRYRRQEMSLITAEQSSALDTHIHAVWVTIAAMQKTPRRQAAAMRLMFNFRGERLR